MKTTLQARLMMIIVFFSFFLVSAFTFIQVQNQIGQERENAMYQARQDALLVKNELEAVKGEGQDAPSEEQILNEAKRIFNELISAGVVKKATLLAANGSPAVLEGDMSFFLEDDPAKLKMMFPDRNFSKWLSPSIDKRRKAMDLYIRFQNDHGHIVKLTFSLEWMQRGLRKVYVPVMLIVLAVVGAAAALTASLSFVILSPIKKLNKATKDVADGNLDMTVSLDTNDELQELAETFNHMTGELKKMKIRAENANPLTKLPGNVIIREQVEQKLVSGEKFVLIYADLDNFKAFNDKYGVSAGDDVISLTAEIMKDSVKENGGEGDFVGHEGGDDFLILTTPERAEAVASGITGKFDVEVRKFYDEEDLKNGYIESKSREGDNMVKFPIMTISLAGVGNQDKELSSYPQITNIAATVKKAVKGAKKHLKTAPKSTFIMDRRVEDLGSQHRQKQ